MSEPMDTQLIGDHFNRFMLGKPKPDSIYMMLQSFDVGEEQHLHHWSLYATGQDAPAGRVFSAIKDPFAGGRLRFSIKDVDDPAQERGCRIVIYLELGKAPHFNHIHELVRLIPVTPDSDEWVMQAAKELWLWGLIPDPGLRRRRARNRNRSRNAGTAQDAVVGASGSSGQQQN